MSAPTWEVRLAVEGSASLHAALGARLSTFPPAGFGHATALDPSSSLPRDPMREGSGEWVGYLEADTAHEATMQAWDVLSGVTACDPRAIATDAHSVRVEVQRRYG